MRLGTHEISSLQRCLEVMERIENPWASQHNREHRANLKIEIAFKLNTKRPMGLSSYTTLHI